MASLRFTVPFIAVQERPRRVTRGRKSWWYSPTSKEQGLIGQIALVARLLHKKPVLTGDCWVQVLVYGLKRGDLDNVIKALLDGCNKILWDDDRQVKEIYARVMEGKDQRMDIEVDEFGANLELQ